MAYYINNDVLRNCIATYNANNIHDKLEWVPKYVEKFQKQFDKGKISKEEYDVILAFIKKKLDTRREVLDKYQAMTPAEKICFEKELDATKTELYGYFNKIVVGRANSLYIHKDPALDPDEVRDIITDSIITLFNYSNRYDTDRGTSTFCYFTEVATNAIKGGINAVKARKEVLVTGFDFLDNMESGSNEQDDYD